MQRKNQMLVVSMAVNSIVLGAVSMALGQATGTTGATNTTASTSAAAAQQTPIGRVTANYGVASIYGVAGTRAGELHTLLNNEDRIVTDGGGMSVLLASRVVLKIDANSSLIVREGTGKTDLVLEYGSVQVFVGKRPADYGAVTLQDAHAKVDASDGVFLASYDPVAKDGYYACEHSTVTLTGDDGKPMKLNADEQAFVDAGQVRTSGALDRVAYADRKKSLERLGQSALAQSSQVFRLRSRTFDTESALSQLSAAGWIDRSALAAKTAKTAAVKKDSKDSDSNSEASNGSTTTTGGNTAVASTGSTPAKSGNGEPSEVPVTASGPVAATNTGVSSVPSSDPVTLNTTAGSSTGSGVAPQTEPSRALVPVKSDLGLGSSSGSGADALTGGAPAEPVVTTLGNGPKPGSVLPPKADLGLGSANSGTTGVSPTDGGVRGGGIASNGSAGNGGEGNSGASSGHGSHGTSFPNGGLDLGTASATSSGATSSGGASSVPPLADLGTGGSSSASGALGGQATSAGPKVSIPKLDSAGGKGGSLPKLADLDVGITRGSAGPSGSGGSTSSGSGGTTTTITPPVTTVSIPKIDSVIPKADIGLGELPMGGTTGAGSTGVIPKPDSGATAGAGATGSGAVPTIDSGATTPKITIPTAGDVTGVVTGAAGGTAGSGAGGVPANPDAGTAAGGAGASPGTDASTPPADGSAPAGGTAIPTPADAGVKPAGTGADGTPVTDSTAPKVDKPKDKPARAPRDRTPKAPKK